MPEGPDYQLRRQVADLTNLAVRLDQNIGNVAGQVAAVDVQQRETRNELGQLRDHFVAWVRKAELTANLQLATTEIGNLNDELTAEFGHHDLARRTATGMLEAFDTGLVSERTIQSVGEQLMVQTPRYWLAPALVALSAWSADEPELCERAVLEAFRRSPERTSLFFALVLRRQSRMDGSVRWLHHYLARQDPMRLNREFAVILESVSHGAFGAAGRQLIRDTVDGWLTMLQNDEAAQNAQIDRWRAEIEGHRAPSAAEGFPRLVEMCPQWPQLEAMLSAAEAHRRFIDHYRALLAASDPPSASLEDAIDDILDHLVSDYDIEELPLRRKLAFFEAVKEHGGDMDVAEHAAKANLAALEDTLDYLTVQTAAALTPAAIGVSASTQRVALATCAPWIYRAYGMFTKDYRTARPAPVEAQFKSKTAFGANTFQLPTWTGDLGGTPMDQLERSLAGHWDQYTKPFLDKLRFDMKQAAVVPVLVVLAVLVFGSAANVGFGLIGGALLGIFWAVVLVQRRDAADRNRATVMKAIDGAKLKSLADLRGAGAELTDYATRFRAADALEGEAGQLIAAFRALGTENTQYDTRTVHHAGAADDHERRTRRRRRAGRAVGDPRGRHFLGPDGDPAAVPAAPAQDRPGAAWLGAAPAG